MSTASEQQTSATPDPVEFSITRVFPAPRQLVYQAWTERERLQQWWGPVGMALSVLTLEVQPGGNFHYAMKAPGGFEMWGKFVYRELQPFERMVYVNSFADATGNAIPAPIMPSWPLEALNVLTFTEENGMTTQTLRSTPINASALEKQTFLAGHASMTQGFTSTLNQLEAYLATLTA